MRPCVSFSSVSSFKSSCVLHNLCLNQSCLPFVLRLVPATLGQGVQPVPSSRPLLVLDPAASPSSAKTSYLSPASVPPPDPPPSPPQPSARSVSSHPPFLSPDSVNNLLNEPLCLTPAPPTSSQSLPFPSLASGFSIFSPRLPLSGLSLKFGVSALRPAPLFGPARCL